MPKVVILGSCRHEPYIVLLAPNKLDRKLYEKDHEKAYEEATKVFFKAIDEADEVWVYAPDGLGKHTQKDINYAKQHGKTIRFLVDMHQVPVLYFRTPEEVKENKGVFIY